MKEMRLDYELCLSSTGNGATVFQCGCHIDEGERKHADFHLERGIELDRKLARNSVEEALKHG